MKRNLIYIIFLIISLSVYGQSAKTIDLAIMEATIRIDERLNSGTKIAVINFTSTSDQFSSHVIDEITANLVDSRKLIVVDRRELELIRDEMRFQMSGEVSDESMQSIGRMLGAQSIITGSFTEIGSTFRMVIRVLNVQTAAIEVQYRTDITRDKRLSTFFPKEKTTGDKIGTGALNIIFGLGSYIEGDIGGGITISAGYAIAAGLIIFEVTALDWDSPMVNVPGIIGLGVGGVTLAYSFIRPFIFNRSKEIAQVMDNTQIRIVQIPNQLENNSYGVQLFYSFKF